MTTTASRTAPPSPGWHWLRHLVPGGVGRGALHVVERNATAYRRQWHIFLTGLLEPALYLVSIGIGVGGLVGKVAFGGEHIDYKAFVAPGLMSAAAMNGAVLDTTFNFFFKFKYSRAFDAMLATPLRVRDVAYGEMTWALLRGAAYCAAFLVTMAIAGLVHSWWAILALPTGLLIGAAFASAGMAGTSFMRSFLDFDYVNLALIPMFLFSGVFFPVSRYPGAVRVIVELTPLYQGVALERAFVLGHVGWGVLLHVAYLAALAGIALRIASRRLARRLQP